jgi:dTDP-glucose pyrophosphorylase
VTAPGAVTVAGGPPADLRRLCVPESGTVRDAMVAVDTGAATICLVLDGGGLLAGVLTDGDLRRALLAGATLADPLAPHVNRRPHVVAPDVPRSHVMDLMRALRIAEVPVLDAGRPVGLHTLTALVGRPELPTTAVIMAGGRGTRLGALTSSRPKPLMTVAGRTVLEWMLLELVGAGVRRVHVSIGHLGDQIVEHLGDGERFGCTVRYLREDPEHPLGTAGALSLLPAAERTDPVVVVNGDLLVNFSVDQLLEHHRASGAALTVAARTYTHAVPFGVLDVADDRTVRAVTEKPTLEVEVSSGVYAVSPEVLADLPVGEPAGFPEVIERCLAQGRTVSAWPLESDWIDVGTPADLARARGQQ